MSFDQSIRRIGFACKFMHSDQSLPAKHLKEIQSQLTERITTDAWMQRQMRDIAYEKMWELIDHNVHAARRLVEYVGSLAPGQRMVRLGSDQLPFYTLQPWAEFYKRNDVQEFLARHYAVVGARARELDVRLSMHPGQFCCIVSENASVVDRSLQELDYHVQVAQWMGYGNTWRDFKINVHLSGRQGPAGFQTVYNRMSPELRNMLTIENDEFSSGLDTVLQVSHLVPIVFDSHHYFINTCGGYLMPGDDRWKRVIDSWQGVRPTMHYSISREEYFTTADYQCTLPAYSSFESRKISRSKLRAHSDYYHHSGLNGYIGSFWSQADIMAESKMKNLASTQLYNTLKGD